MNKVKGFFVKFWQTIRESKLNMGMFVTGAIAFVLMVTIVCIIIFRGDGIDNTLIIQNENTTTLPKTSMEKETTTEPGTTKKGEEETEEYSTKINENETTNVVYSPSLLRVTLSVTQSWIDGGEYFVQYSMNITNVSGRDIKSWAVVLDMRNVYELVDSWSFNFKKGYRKLIINPTMNNRNLEAGESVTGGFIVKGTTGYVYVDYYTAYIGSKVETIRNTGGYIRPTTPTSGDRETTTGNENTTTPTGTKPEEETTGDEDTTTIAGGETSETDMEFPTDDETTTPDDEGGGMDSPTETTTAMQPETESGEDETTEEQVLSGQ